ncbi:MAG: MBL fold metallo-hydrolase [Acidobacteriota bacterium]
MRVEALELGPFGARCVLLGCERTGAAAVVDPGFEPEAIVEEVERRRLAPGLIVLTHAHIDHAWGAAAVKRAFPRARLLLHPGDRELFGNLAMQARMFGFPAPPPVPEDGELADGDRLRFGDIELLVRHTPGHSPGHVVLLHEDAERPAAVVGDVLFAGSIGRTDLWGGSYEQLERSIRQVLYRLPAHTRVVCGHGPDTTIGEEMASNPFVSAYS